MAEVRYRAATLPSLGRRGARHFSIFHPPEEKQGRPRFLRGSANSLNPTADSPTGHGIFHPSCPEGEGARVVLKVDAQTIVRRRCCLADGVSGLAFSLQESRACRFEYSCGRALVQRNVDHLRWRDVSALRLELG